MMPEISGWINKAEGDWGTLLREHSITINPNLDAVCFHAQQCAEKYLKARLTEAGIEFRKTHDLTYLYELVLQAEPKWTFLKFGLSDLNAFAVASRYPGLDANQEQAERAVEYCRVIRITVRMWCDLPSDD